ncbi:MAG: histidinol-phosphate transaminase [Bacteroidota bacterium]
MKPAVSFDLHTWMRPHLRQLKPYSSARDEFSGQAEVFLDANENALGSTGGGDFHRYPDPYARAIKAKLAPMLGVGESHIFLGNGSDEPIDLLIRAFCNPGKEEILIVPPTYGMYRVSADINAVAVREVPLTADFQLDVPAILAAISPTTKLLFLCSPNNPTGNCLRESAVEAVLYQFPGVVVMDEAYVDFAKTQNWLRRLEEFPNLVVLRTFSKAWGLAGLRVGMAFGQAALIDLLNQIKPPYNLNLLSQQAVGKALDRQAEKEAKVQLILEEKNTLLSQLTDLPFVEKVFPSEANFLLVRVDEPQVRYHQLLKEQIIVRDRSRVLLCENCLRITIGSPDENQRLLSVLQSLS